MGVGDTLHALRRFPRRGKLEFGRLSAPKARAAARMADQSAKADALVAQAKKRLASWLNLTSNKYEDAAELFAKAANLYKASKKCASPRSAWPPCRPAVARWRSAPGPSPRASHTPASPSVPLESHGPSKH